MSLSASAQIGQYQSLNLPAGTHSAALGGRMVSIADGELMQFLNNPAVLDTVLAGEASINYNPHVADINVFSGAYNAEIGGTGNWAIGLTYLNYGEFVERDAAGAELGQFTANDFVFAIGKSHYMGPFSMGASVKYVNSSIESYQSSMIAFDLGGLYRHPTTDFTFGLVFKNLGFRLADYYELANSEVPFDVQMGMTFKPEHMPFRFTLTGYNLVEEHMVFKTDATEQSARTSAGFDRVLRRINIGSDLLLNDSFQLHFGYNHLRRQELKLDDSAEGAGFSFGFSMGIKKMKFRYARSKYHAAGAANYISLETNLNSYKKIL